MRNLDRNGGTHNSWEFDAEAQLRKHVGDLVTEAARLRETIARLERKIARLQAQARKAAARNADLAAALADAKTKRFPTKAEREAMAG